MAVHIDESLWPTVVVTFRGSHTDADFDGFLAHLTRIAERDGVKAVVFDARLSTEVSAAQRSRMARWIMNDMKKGRGRCEALAFVFSSALVRGMLTAVQWVTPIKIPYNVFAGVNEAKTWCAARLAERTAQKTDGTVRRPA